MDTTYVKQHRISYDLKKPIAQIAKILRDYIYIVDYDLKCLTNGRLEADTLLLVLESCAILSHPTLNNMYLDFKNQKKILEKTPQELWNDNQRRRHAIMEEISKSKIRRILNKKLMKEDCIFPTMTQYGLEYRLLVRGEKVLKQYSQEIPKNAHI